MAKTTDGLKIQNFLEDKEAIEIYKNLRRGLRGRAIEQALKMLFTSKNKDIYFLGNQSNQIVQKQPTGKESTNNKKVQIAWD